MIIYERQKVEGNSDKRPIEESQTKISSNSFSLSKLFELKEKLERERKKERNGSCDGTDAEDSTQTHRNCSLCASQSHAQPLFRSPLSSRSTAPGLSISTFSLYIVSIAVFRCSEIVYKMQKLGLNGVNILKNNFLFIYL